MKTKSPPTRASLKWQLGRTLATLRKASADFSPDSDRRFRELKNKAEALRLAIYFMDQKS